MKTGKIIGFYKKRFIYFAISLTIMLVGIIAVFINGVQLDIQFKGGALLKYTYEGELNDVEVADVASGLLNRPVTTQITTDLITKQKRLVINIAGNNGLEASEQDRFNVSLKEKYPDAQLLLSESSMVEPFFGHRFLRNGIFAILLSALLVMLYVWIRFKRMGGLSAGVMALVALLHDVLIVFFTCVIFKIAIGDAFIAVALSIIGYSINDTIVIYDRIRENTDTYKKLSVDKITDLSISQSMFRSINTNIAVLISVSLIYILAYSHNIQSIQSFALPMAIGSISGCYSTICIAGPLWVMWKTRKTNKNVLATEK